MGSKLKIFNEDLNKIQTGFDNTLAYFKLLEKYYELLNSVPSELKESADLQNKKKEIIGVVDEFKIIKNSLIANANTLLEINNLINETV